MKRIAFTVFKHVAIAAFKNYSEFETDSMVLRIIKQNLIIPYDTELNYNELLI